MTVREDELRFAEGQELDRLANIMGYKRSGRIFKESDFDFKYRLIEMNQKFLCKHKISSRMKSYGNHLGSCGDCGEIFV
jgi:hypothetical protein